MKSWLEAQLALLAADMVDLDQTLLPFMQVDDSGRTLYELYRDQTGGNAPSALPVPPPQT